MKLLARSQRGETIMEVLICVGIVGFMMTAAFTLSNKNQSSVRASFERNEAVKVAETQIEKLRFYADKYDLPTTTDTAGKPFCINDKADSTQSITMFDNLPSLDATTDTDVAKYAGKKLGTTTVDQCYSATSAGQFRYAIWPPGTATSKFASDSGKYLVTVHWESANGTGVDALELYYEIYNTSNPLYGASGALAQCRNGFDDDVDLSKPKGGIDFPADKGCTSADDPDETNPECNDGIDNADPEDSLIDDADPACTTTGVTSEVDPETVALFTVTANAANPYNCLKVEIGGDAADGCHNLGTSMYLRRTVKVTYDMSTSVRPGTSTLTINYREYDDPDHSAVPPSYVGYRLRLTGGGVDTTITLPASAPGVAASPPFTKEITFSSSPRYLTFEWLNNDSAAGGYDADLQFDSVGLNR